MRTGKGCLPKTAPSSATRPATTSRRRCAREFDNAKRIKYAQDLQNYLGKQQYFFHALGSATGFNVAWPVMRNFSVFQGLQWGYLQKRFWIDDTQAPLKK